MLLVVRVETPSYLALEGLLDIVVASVSFSYTRKLLVAVIIVAFLTLKF